MRGTYPPPNESPELWDRFMEEVYDFSYDEIVFGPFLSRATMAKQQEVAVRRFYEWKLEQGIEDGQLSFC